MFAFFVLNAEKTEKTFLPFVFLCENSEGDFLVCLPFEVLRRTVQSTFLEFA